MVLAVVLGLALVGLSLVLGLVLGLGGVAVVVLGFALLLSLLLCWGFVCGLGGCAVLGFAV